MSAATTAASLAVLLIALPAGAEEVTIGAKEVTDDMPWSNGCSSHQHHQALVLTGETGTAMSVESITWCCAATSGEPVSYIDLEVYLGLCPSDQLQDDFESNYVPGSRTLVFQAETLNVDAGPGDTFSIDLDVPYSYSGEENLLIEVIHDPGSWGLWGWSWVAGDARSLGRYGNPGPGVLDDRVPWMLLSGGLSLEHSTFGSLKATVGGD